VQAWLSWSEQGTFNPGRAASGWALAPEPPRATVSQPEPIRTVILGKPSFPRFLGLSLAPAKAHAKAPAKAQPQKKVVLSQLNPNLVKIMFWSNFHSFTTIRVEPAQSDFCEKKCLWIWGRF